MSNGFALVTDARDLPSRDRAVAMCLGLLKVAARAANDTRANFAMRDSEAPESLVVLLEMMQRTFPNLEQANQVIAWMGLRFGFQIEERIIDDAPAEEGRA